ncbi:MAG: AEC family transporter [Dongiaceae bacterium]
MVAILDVVLPVFGVILAGWLCGRFRLLGEASSEALNRFVYFVALPALFFVSTARVPLAGIFNAAFLATYGGGVLAAAIPAALICRRLWPERPAALVLQALAATFANTGYMGLPLLIAAFGKTAALAGVLATVLNGAVVMAAGIALIEADLARAAGPGRILGDAARAVGRSPLVLSAVGGIAWSALGLPVPTPLGRFCDLLGAAAPPSALFAMGLFLAGRRIARSLPEVSLLTAVKLVGQPAATWAIGRAAGLDAAWLAWAVTLAALPTGSLVFILAQQYGIYVQRAVAVILLSTLVSVVTLSLLFLWLGVG